MNGRKLASWAPWVLIALLVCGLGVSVFFVWMQRTQMQADSRELVKIKGSLSDIETSISRELEAAKKRADTLEKTLHQSSIELKKIETSLSSELEAAKERADVLEKTLDQSSIDGASIYQDVKDSICAMVNPKIRVPIVGTCFLYQDNRHVLTVAHMVRDVEPSSIYVQFGTYKPVNARIARLDDSQDLVLLELSEAVQGGKPLLLADDVAPGQWVVAIGHPYGRFRNSIRAGVIAGLRRGGNDPEFFGACPTCTDLTEVYGRAEEGTSGSPVLNFKREVIGIVESRVGTIALLVSADTIRKFLGEIGS